MEDHVQSSYRVSDVGEWKQEYVVGSFYIVLLAFDDRPQKDCLGYFNRKVCRDSEQPSVSFHLILWPEQLDSRVKRMSKYWNCRRWKKVAVNIKNWYSYNKVLLRLRKFENLIFIFYFLPYFSFHRVYRNEARFLWNNWWLELAFLVSFWVLL